MNNPATRKIRALAMIAVLLVYIVMSGPAAGNEIVSSLVLGGKKPSGGLVLVKANCGCNKIPKDYSKNDKELLPTRCLQKSAAKPKDKNNQAYPSHVYPEGYPDGFNKINLGAGQKIPFPGWPAMMIPGKNSSPKWQKQSTWNSSKRNTYKFNYCHAEGSHIPGKDKDDHCREDGHDKQTKTALRRAKMWPRFFQIHHILEQKHNGRDDCSNMVPVWSKATEDNINEHQKYTNFWERIRVDSEVWTESRTTTDKNRKKKLQTVWKAIMTCPVQDWVASAPGKTSDDCFN